MIQLRRRTHKQNEFEHNLFTERRIIEQNKKGDLEHSQQVGSLLELTKALEVEERASGVAERKLQNVVKPTKLYNHSSVERVEKPRTGLAYLFVILLAVSVFYSRQTLRYQRFAELTLPTSTKKNLKQPEIAVNMHIQLTGLRWEVPRHLFKRETDFFKRRKVVFVATSGRTGTGFLSKLFSLTENTVSLHEPWPRLEGRDLEKSLLQKGAAESSKKERKLKKVRQIEQILSSSSPTTSYVETSHMFIKTMADFLLDELASSEKFFILILRRNLVATINSQYTLGWFQPAHNGYKKWYYGIHDVSEESRVLVPDRPESEYDVVDKLIGYNLDIELRIQKLILYLKSQPQKYCHVHIIPSSLSNRKKFHGSNSCLEMKEYI
ncbi:uncharacterized protein Gasu_08760 [Galdieria sulphuraria]|uniref:Uncharacterized protein n=1 Tax=Galdieria sulphuraria TaxID=130081 RepID=M2XNP5_GALSU|nr:uncharacterized protein Gasu_08760 [Galdieria sulphuraria]EME31797.1 hypothetical protein Gasu_08760 [Galdieria sulphuraria]|eukprot:XP_005708317.1 hypothetical protein Gasu_08760 [Galdieria sulphuraria]